MKLRNYTVPVLSLLSVLTSTTIQAGSMGPAQVAAPGQLYVGVFGGGGSSNNIGISQYGTELNLEALGGPVAINALGNTNSPGVWLVGGQIGYQWTEILSNTMGITPSTELEGFYIGKQSYQVHEVNTLATDFTQRDYLATYPLDASTFLVNAVVNFNPASYNKIRPYVGAGFGGAVVSITDANSLQTAPVALPSMNQFNTNPSGRTSTLAAQVKVGIGYSFSEHIGVFAEYRWLYLADTDYTFGSRVYPNATATTNWKVNIGSQQYNLGAAGIRFSI